MAFWWVNQNQTYREEHAGGYLWAPLKDKGGGTPFHWDNMKRVAAGDVVFCYVSQAITAVAYLADERIRRSKTVRVCIRCRRSVGK